MMRRAASLLLIALLAQGLCLMPAMAQDDDMSFGVDEVEEESPVAEFLKEGKALTSKKKNSEASLLFYKVLEATDPASEALHPEAQYELGKALLRMKLYQGSLSYLGRIVDAGETHPYYPQTLNGLLMLTDVIPEDPTLMSRLEAYVGESAKLVPPKYKQRYAFLVGRHLFNQGNFTQAQQLLKRVRPNSKNFVKARYIMGVNSVGQYDAKAALKSFKEVLRVLVTRKDEGKLKPEELELLNQTYLGMARVFYSTGAYDKSLKYFDKVPRQSNLWGKSLFESSWAHFQRDEYNKALGNLHSLSSPFFAKSYFPEAPILSAVLFFYNCKYPRVKYVLEEFEYSYMPLKGEIEQVLSKNEEGSAMYEWLTKLRSGDSDEDEKLTRILAASLDDKQVLRRLALVETIDSEEAKIKGMTSQWRTSGLGSALNQETLVARELAINDAGELVKTRLGRVKTELDDLILKRERILFEVSRAEQGELEANFRSEMVVAKDVTKGKEIEVNDEQLYWTFDGEYWKDELGYYIFNINTECKR